MNKDQENIQKDIASLRNEIHLFREEIEDLKSVEDEYKKYRARVTTLELALQELERRLPH